MAAVAPSVAAVAAAAATTSSSPSSSASSNTDLATGIVVIIVICSVVIAFLAGLVCFCVRRRKTKKRRAALLATAQHNAENARLSQQQLQGLQYPPQEAGTYQEAPTHGYMNEMPAYPSQTVVEKDGQARHEVWNPPLRPEMYLPRASAELSTGVPPSSELDGSYGNLPMGPESDVSSPMLRKEHEQVYSKSWKAAGSGG